MTDQNKKQVSYQLPVAASILFQGYYLVKAFREGLEEVVCNGKVVMSREQMNQMKSCSPHIAEKDPKQLFEMFDKGELNPAEVYSVACELQHSLVGDTRLKSIFDRLGKKDYDLSVEDAVYASRKILGGYSK